MSKVVKEHPYRVLSHIVECNNELYYVDSTDTFDAGYETMVFDYDGVIDGDVNEEDICWSGVYTEHYYSYEDMEKRHNYLIEHLEEVL